jgi:hypothetical protein
MSVGAVLHVHQDDVDAALVQRLDPLIDAARKSSGSTRRMASSVPVCQMTSSGFVAEHLTAARQVLGSHAAPAG